MHGLHILPVISVTVSINEISMDSPRAIPCEYALNGFSILCNLHEIFVIRVMHVYLLHMLVMHRTVFVSVVPMYSMYG
jgi:hypothetical protein